MLRNIVQLIESVAICTAAMCFYCVCYAEMTEHEIYIDCSKGDGTTLVHTYSGKPDTQLFLITEGMQIAGKEELVIDWDEFKSSQGNGEALPNPSIFAECVPYANGE